MLLSTSGVLTFITVTIGDSDSGGGITIVPVYRKHFTPEDLAVHTDVSQRCSHFDTDGTTLVVATGKHRFAVHTIRGNRREIVDDGSPVTFHKATTGRGWSLAACTSRHLVDSIGTPHLNCTARER